MWIPSNNTHQTEIVQLTIFMMQGIMLFILTDLTEFRPPVILKV